MKWLEAQEMRVLTMAEVDRHGFEKVLDKAIDQALDGTEHLYLSFDMDSLDSSVAPGCVSPEPGGFSAAQGMNAVRRIAAEVGLVGMDVVELLPSVEGGKRTAQIANCLVYEAIVGLAMRKQGLTERNYVHPRSSGDHHWGE